jgi:HSP20 family protein
MPDNVRNWMWPEAVEMLVRAERLRNDFFRPAQRVSRTPIWEPPADVFETESEVLVLVAVPGVDPEQVEAVIDHDALRVAGVCKQHPALRTAAIHRLELPHGRFERRIPLPPGRYAAVTRQSVNGCLLVTMQKAVTRG